MADRRVVEEVKAAYHAASSPVDRIVVLNDSRWPLTARLIAATEVRDVGGEVNDVTATELQERGSASVFGMTLADVVATVEAAGLRLDEVAFWGSSFGSLNVIEAGPCT